jgi:hypothetical protein
MTRLLADIERHLERVRTIEAASISDAALDLAHHEAMLVALFERAESRGKKAGGLWLDLEEWLDGNLEELVEPLHWELLAVFGRSLDAPTRQSLIDWELASGSGLTDLGMVSPPSKSMQTWLQKRESDLYDLYGIADGWPLSKDRDFPWRIVPRYCERIGLVAVRPEAPQLRMPGHMWLRLRGLDRLRWLLALEAEHAVGDDDPWRASDEQANCIIRNAGRSLGPVLMEDVARADHPNGSATRSARSGVRSTPPSSHATSRVRASRSNRGSIDSTISSRPRHA